MKIAFLNTYGNGSTGKIIDELKKTCLKNNIVTISIFSREFCRSPETSIRCFSKLGFYFDALMTRLFDRHGLNSFNNTRRVIKELSKFNPDLIHIHNLHGYWINYKMLFKWIKKNNKKVVFTLHDCWLFTGHCTHFDYIGCEKWINGCYKCEQKKEYPTSWFGIFAKRNYFLKKKYFDMLCPTNVIVVTPSNWLNDLVKKSFLNKFKSYVINNGVDLEIFHSYNTNFRETYKINDKHIVLCVANYWNERKGLSYVLDISLMRKDLFFVVIGKIKNDNFEQKDYQNILFIERTENQEQLAMWYSEADVYLNTTLEDTYPTTNLESIACGTPVLTFKTGGSPEIVDATGCGMVIDRNVGAINDGLNELLSKKMKHQNININFDLLDAKKKFDEYINIYDFKD